MGFLFGYFFAFIFVTISLFFSLMAYTQRNETFFYIGIAVLGLTTVALISNYEYIWYAVNNGELMTLGIIAGWITSVVFLILSKTKPTKSGENITDSFLDDIINAEDEEWDPES